MTFTVRALAFHHESGYEAQMKLAREFASKDGRVATMEDIVHARMHSPVTSFVWTQSIVTASRIYSGTIFGNRVLIIAHGNGPQHIRVQDLRAYEDLKLNEKYRSQKNEWVIEKEDFEKLVGGQYGKFIVIVIPGSDFDSEHTATKHEMECRDEVIHACLGCEADLFIRHYRTLLYDWLARDDENCNNAPLFASRMFGVYDWAGTPTDSSEEFARVFPLTMERAGFYTDDHSRAKTFATVISNSLNSGIDNLGGPAFYVVGVRGKEPVTEVVSDFRCVSPQVKRAWNYFVEPLEGVIHDPYIGVKPDGSPERPYYLPTKWGSPPLTTGRILENGTGSNVPEYRVVSCELLDGPERISFWRENENGYSGYPFPGQWNAALRALPEGANAIAFGTSVHHAGKIEVETEFYVVEPSHEPYHILMRCGEHFFTQYNGRNDITNQPRVLVKNALSVTQANVSIPRAVARMTGGGIEYWPILSYLVAQSPNVANALWIERYEPDGLTIRVHYFFVELGNVAFRPFAEIRSDFDWQIERRMKAGLL